MYLSGKSRKMLRGGKSGLTERKLLFRGKWVALKRAVVFPLLSWIGTSIPHVPSLPLTLVFVRRLNRQVRPRRRWPVALAGMAQSLLGCRCPRRTLQERRRKWHQSRCMLRCSSSSGYEVQICSRRCVSLPFPLPWLLRADQPWRSGGVAQTTHRGI